MNSPTRLRLAICAAVATAITSLSGGAGLAQDVTMQEAVTKVNLAGRQRMLSQRMSKAACLVARDVDFQSHYDQLTQAHALFAETDQALRAGNSRMGLQAETRQSVLTALSKVDGPWLHMNAVVSEIFVNGEVDEEHLFRADIQGLEVLKFMNMAVNQTARAYGSVTPDVPLAMTITVDVAGRQRMLTQKMVKELCLMGVTEDPSELRGKLTETVQIFDLSLNALINGYEDVGVIAAPSADIMESLEVGLEMWAEIKPLFDEAISGGEVTDAMLSEVSRKTEPLLRTINETVGLYGAVEPSEMASRI